MEQLDLLANQLDGHHRKAGDISGGASQIVDETGAHRIGNADEHHRDVLGRPLPGQCRRQRYSDQDIDLLIDEVLGHTLKSLRPFGRKPVFKDNRLDINVAELGKTLTHRGTRHVFLLRARRMPEHADSWDLAVLLRLHRERVRGETCRRSTEQQIERTSVHSITSSARASSVGGTWKSIALAVFRLTTSSYLVGACTGRSPGFSPRRIRLA